MINHSSGQELPELLMWFLTSREVRFWEMADSDLGIRAKIDP
jgi:hypothetical protein